MRDLACVVHVHSTYSDGTATVGEIVGAARSAGADAVLLTDHDTLAARRAGWEGWHEGVLVVVGMEVSPRAGHLLAFGIDEEIAHRGRSEPELCAAVQAAGGLGFPAHPFSTGSAISKAIGRPHPWGALETCETTGLELWSVVTDCAERCATLRELVQFVRRPERAIDRPPARSLERWDALCRDRRVVAIGGLDAHQTGIRLAGRVLSPHPHERIFRTVRTHVLTRDDPEPHDVLAALRDGRCYLAVDSLAPAHGFGLWAQSADRVVPMGAEAPAGRWTLQARLPRAADLALLRDGEAVERTYADGLERTLTETGVFRVEAAIDDRAWIISNPVYLR
jgi:hypothetical protein